MVESGRYWRQKKLLQALIVLVNYTIWSFLQNKPLGLQSLLDTAVKDLAIGKSWGRCYDHNFLRFLPNFGKNWRFSQKPML
jgi:hypothetical protein